MKAIESEPTPFITPAVDEFVPTKADTESPITRKGVADEQGDEGWQNLINQLIEWGISPDSIADEGIEAPSRNTVQLTADLALALKRAGFDCPDAMVPDPNGGIVLEYGTRNASIAYHVWHDGTIDRCTFNGPRLMERSRLL
jgi:hypothetical protein